MDAQLIVHEAGEGVWNLAVDEALLTQAAHNGKAALRFYQWRGATLSLGYFQRLLDRETHPASKDLPLVRRPSGGGAIVHDRELTYSFACPVARRMGSADELYLAFHQTLVDTLGELGLEARLCESPGGAPDAFLCFQRHTRGDVLCGEDKLAGSAQRRRSGAVMQHGSVLLDRSPAAPELPGAGQFGLPGLTPERLIRGWLPAIERELDLELAPTDITAVDGWIEEEATKLAQPNWRSRR